MTDDELIERLKNAAESGDNDFNIAKYMLAAAKRIEELNDKVAELEKPNAS